MLEALFVVLAGLAVLAASAVLVYAAWVRR